MSNNAAAIEKIMDGIEELAEERRSNDDSQNVKVERDNKLLEKLDAIGDALAATDKAMYVLGHLQDEYYSADSPDPQSAIEYGSGQCKDNEHGKHSYWWFRGYEDICEAFEIVLDYVAESRSILQEAKK